MIGNPRLDIERHPCAMPRWPRWRTGLAMGLVAQQLLRMAGDEVLLAVHCDSSSDMYVCM